VSFFGFGFAFGLDGFGAEAVVAFGAGFGLLGPALAVLVLLGAFGDGRLPDCVNCIASAESAAI
jgi:hypothetical protein